MEEPRDSIPYDSTYEQEFQTLFDAVSGDSILSGMEDDPFLTVYKKLAEVAVTCFVLYVGMRGIEKRLSEEQHKED